MVQHVANISILIAPHPQQSHLLSKPLGPRLLVEGAVECGHYGDRLRVVRRLRQELLGGLLTHCLDLLVQGHVLRQAGDVVSSVALQYLHPEPLVPIELAVIPDDSELAVEPGHGVLPPAQMPSRHHAQVLVSRSDHRLVHAQHSSMVGQPIVSLSGAPGLGGEQPVLVALHPLP